ncbi:sigma-70 family RNA polymerase sigma factor [Leptospira wolffii]|uniref:RNA polymerase sigma factor n=1 Tax=Leptospira wolffii TaxID=409998 RepID=UPI00108254D4|nr:sigma-70 family RNA polymerase sigma factor [Leptospira wolffii]TGL44052.1 sigma-70 family RNA polymerase sigma factor [Leptospira wolffii]
MQDPEQISDVYEKGRKSLFVYFYSLTGEREKAEDLVQEVFLILSKNPEKFDPNKGSIYSWGSVVGRNLFYRELQKSKRISFQDSEKMESFFADGSDPQSEFLESSDRNHKLVSLSDCLKILPESEKEIVREKFDKNSTLVQIGNKLGITKRSVSRRYADVLKKLRACLEKKGVGL